MMIPAVSAQALSWSLVSQLMDPTDPCIPPTDMTFHLEEEEDTEEDEEEGFHLVRGAVQVPAHSLVLSLVSPVFRHMLYGDNPVSSVHLVGVSLPALRALISHIYGCQVDWTSLTTTQIQQVWQMGNQYEIVGLKEAKTEHTLELSDGEQEQQYEQALAMFDTVSVSSTESFYDEDTVEDMENMEENIAVEKEEKGKTLVMFDDVSVNSPGSFYDKNIETVPVEEMEKLEENSLFEEEENYEDYEEKYEEAYESVYRDGGDEEIVEMKCSNCDCVACRDGQVICSTLEFGGRLGCQVAVANCVRSYWGNGYRAQRGEVTKLDSPSTVTVRWVDGSESQYNVYITENPETDTVLCFHCREKEDTAIEGHSTQMEETQELAKYIGGNSCDKETREIVPRMTKSSIASVFSSTYLCL